MLTATTEAFGKRPHERFALFSGFFVLALNALAALVRPYGVVQLVATATLVCSLYPTWRFLRLGDENLPFFPSIVALYGLYYALFLLTPFEPYVTYIHVPSESVLHASVLSLVGVLLLVTGYYGRFVPLPLSGLPRFSLHWSPAKARRAALVLGAIGFLAQATRLVYEVPSQLDAIVYLLAQLSLFSIGILFYLSLQRLLTGRYRALLWLALVPLQVATDLSVGSVFPLIRLASFLLMIYVRCLRIIPWRHGIAA